MGKVGNLVKRKLVWMLQTFFACFSESIKDKLAVRTALVIAPHPDDETFGCGGAILRLRAQGTRVRLVIVTDGSAAPSKLDPKNLSKLRQAEAQKAARLLGVAETELVFLSYPDGQIAAQAEAMAKDLAAQIWLCAPDLIFAPYERDGHPDHRAVAQAVAQLRAEGKIACRILSYPMWFWPRGALAHFLTPALFKTHRRLDLGGDLEKKKMAMAAYRSQQDGENPVLGETFLLQNRRGFELFFEQ